MARTSWQAMGSARWLVTTTPGTLSCEADRYLKFSIRNRSLSAGTEQERFVRDWAKLAGAKPAGQARVTGRRR